MGLDIPKFPVYNGGATVACYSNIRDIKQDKRDGKYTLSCLAHITHEDLHVEVMYLEVKSDEPFVDTWAVLYLELKRKLTEKGIEFTDVK
jgi:hypothetical protein